MATATCIRERPAAELTPVYNKSDLKARGWTDAMIRDLLADVENKYMPSCAAGSRYFNYQYYYEAAKVEAIEKTKAFKERKKRRRAKS